VKDLPKGHTWRLERRRLYQWATTPYWLNDDKDDDADDGAPKTVANIHGSC